MKIVWDIFQTVWPRPGQCDMARKGGKQGPRGAISWLHGGPAGSCSCSCSGSCSCFTPTPAPKTVFSGKLFPEGDMSWLQRGGREQQAYTPHTMHTETNPFKRRSLGRLDLRLHLLQLSSRPCQIFHMGNKSEWSKVLLFSVHVKIR